MDKTRSTTVFIGVVLLACTGISYPVLSASDDAGGKSTSLVPGKRPPSSLKISLASSTLTRDASELQNPVTSSYPKPASLMSLKPCLKPSGSQSSLAPGRTRVEVMASSSASAGMSPSTPTYILNIAAYMTPRT